MKRNTIKWKIYKYNIAAIVVLVAFTTVIFNIAVRMYIKNDIKKQLESIAARAEDTALQRGPDFFRDTGGGNPPPPPRAGINSPEGGNDLFRFYFMLDRSLRETLSVVNADYILLDRSNRVVILPQENYFRPSDDIIKGIIRKTSVHEDSKAGNYMSLSISGIKYIAIIRSVSDKNSFGLGRIVIFSSLQKVNQLQWGINLILFAVLVLSALIFAIFSSLAAKKIAAPFSSLNRHLRDMAERNFGSRISMPVDDELQEFVNNINSLSAKLEMYDKSQKTFLQNASHEFRTPLMSIQSHAEGIKYDVVDKAAAADIIIDETGRMKRLVEDLLYLSRLDAIEEHYSFVEFDLACMIKGLIERMNRIASDKNVRILGSMPAGKMEILADEEKLSRAVTNIMENCIRYADSIVEVSAGLTENGKAYVAVSDDGPGFEENEVANVFDRFYKGKKGNSGLGLAISKNIIEKHGGRVYARNTRKGAEFVIEMDMNSI